MYYSTTILAAAALFASTVVASIPGLPPCAQGCITDFGGCNAIDVHCICANEPLISTLACCVSKCCDASGQAAVIQFADSLCSGQGVDNLPTAASCSAGQVAPATSSCAAGSASSSASSSAASSSSSSAESMTTTAPAMSSSPAMGSSSSSSMAAGSSESMASTSAAAAASSGSSSAAAAPTAMVQQLLGLGLGAAGLFAAL